MKAIFIVLTAGYFAFISNVLAQTPSLPSSIALGPFPITENVQGVSVTTEVTSTFTLETESDGLHLAANVAADLFDLQNKFSQIVATFPLPKDNCRSYTLLNPVVSLGNRSLKPEGTSALVAISGEVSGWTCLQNPIPQTYWDPTGCRGNLPFGGHYVFGCPKTRPGSPIKNRTVTQPFDASLPVSLQKINPTSLGLVLGQPNIRLGGQFVGITNGILKIAGVDLNDEAKRALDRAIDPAKLAVSIPPEYAQLQPKIVAARFDNNQGHLTAVVAMTALVPTGNLNQMIASLINNLKKP